MKIAAVTCSVGRPALLRRCDQYIERQTVQPDRRIVIQRDDLKPWDALRLALMCVPNGHHAIIFEDDDWYATNHIETLIQPLRGNSYLAGSSAVRQYNVPARRWFSELAAFTPPCGVGIHYSYVKDYAKALKDRKGDRRAWLGRLPTLQPTMVGIKGVGYGLPGLRGATKDHDPKSKKMTKWVDDTSLIKLHEWLGEDAGFYISCTDLSASF